MIQQPCLSRCANLSIRDVSKICDVPSHTIRFWEKEFKDYLIPARTSGKQRRYSAKEIQRILKIKHLLWSEKFSIEGAKTILRGKDLLDQINGSSEPSTHKLICQIAKDFQQYTFQNQFETVEKNTFKEE